MTARQKSFDSIVVGGGSAGCVAASRLVGEFGARVLLLEAGGRLQGLDPQSPCRLQQDPRRHEIPHAASDRAADAARRPRPDDPAGQGARRRQQRQRPGLYARPRRRLRHLGRNGEVVLWSWETILPHFTRMEANQKFNNRFHGTSGPLGFPTRLRLRDEPHLSCGPCRVMGIPFTPDFNQGSPSGVGYLQMTAGGGGGAAPSTPS